MLVNLLRTVLMSVALTALLWGLCSICQVAIPAPVMVFICFGSWLVSSWAVRSHS
jgi:hypothetical protein